MNALILVIVFVVMLAGIAGTLLPILPGSPLIFLAALGYGFYDHFSHITVGTLVVLGILMLFTFLVDYLSGVVGARRYGATRMGTWGSFIGGILGFVFFNVPGIVLGPFVGAFVGELLGGRQVDQAFKVGIGTLLGFFGGTVIKIITAVVMVVYFIIKLL